MPTKKEITFIDLFAGCGGLSLGLKNAGLKGIWANEIDEFASETYRLNIGEHIFNGDIREVNTKDIPKPDLLVGGFPCQPFSLSGLQNGFEGSSGDLFFHCARFIKDLTPEVFILENVPGFLRLNNGFYFNQARKILTDLGYHVQWKILNASHYEVPQSRERLFIVGNKLNREFIFPEPSNKIITVKEAIEDIRLNMDSFSNNEPMKHTERIKKRFASVLPGETARDAMDRDPSLGNAKITKQCYRRLIPNKPAPTIVANFVTTTIHYAENRNLTAREAARIQSFPDDFIFCGLKTRMSWQKGLSQFEQIGNAVPPKLAEKLGLSVIKLLNGQCPNAIFIPINDINGKQLNIFSESNLKLNKPQVKSRGRTSKFKFIYDKIENAKNGEILNFDIELDSSFEMFCSAAMRRRGINVEIKRISNKLQIQKN